MDHTFSPMSAIEASSNEMASIPGGEIILRDDRIKHTWKIEIQPFLLARYPVTQQLYWEITNESPSSFQGKKNPVENVSWKDSVFFCNLLSINTGLNPSYHIDELDNIILDAKANGFRLPSEAEWEFACRAGTTGIRYGEIDEIAWYKKNSVGRTHEVGMKEPNQWGLFDMLGNVWEWCSDIYDEKVYGAYRIFRGGGWCDQERGCIATNRRRSHPTSFKIDDLGFRIARNMTVDTIDQSAIWGNKTKIL